MIDRYLLRYFLAVIDCGTFSKAAKQLNVAQPTLSVGIGKLERLLGASLFQRTSKRVHITDAGSRLAAHARRIENEFNLAEAAVLDLKPARALRLGVLSTYPMSHLAETIRTSQRAATPERLQIVSGNERELLQRLSRGQVDVALTIVRPESDRFTSEALFTEHYALAMHGGHPLAAKTAIAAEDLSDNTMIVRRHCEVLSETSRHFTERGVRPFFAFRGTNDEQILALVHAGLGVTVMPACYTLKGIVRPLLSGFNLKRQMGLLYAGHADHLRHAASPTLDAVRSRYARTIRERHS
ncbi:MAG: LysR family transcriptional regulator [Gammaproteobacteria bacterium]|nr:LysR family transcriptional regulator [Gammaproteobacteria bacterium]